MSVSPGAARSLFLASLIGALSIFNAGQTVAFEAAYVSADRLEISKFLAPPPAPDSEQQKRDLKAVLDAQAVRSAEQIARANETEQLSVFAFADRLGPDFAKEKLPKTAVLFQHIYEDALALLQPSKSRWQRPRPFLVSSDVHPSGEKPKSGSYPSGNALLGHLYAVVLADLLPQKSSVIFARGAETGDNRVIAGVHFQSDLEAGRQAAAAIAAALWASPRFRDDLDAARAELKATKS